MTSAFTGTEKIFQKQIQFKKIVTNGRESKEESQE